MVRKLALVGASIAIAAAPQPASADSAAIRLSVQVGVQCIVRHQLAGYGQAADGAIGLGEISEYCNARQGYDLVVHYTPGSLRGTTIRAGADEVVLNGSGQSVLSRAAGPRRLTRLVTAVPGKYGFDAATIQFRLVPA